MVPGKGDVLRQNFFAKIANACPAGEGGPGFWNKIGAGADGKAKAPQLVRAEADPTAVSGMAKAHSRYIPVFRARSEGGVFQFDGVIKFVDGASKSDAAGIAWTPDDGKP